MKKLFDEFISNIQCTDEINDEEYYALYPSHRTQFYLMMVSFASNCVDTIHFTVKANDTCKILMYHKYICKHDNSYGETIMHSWYDDKQVYIKYFHMTYNGKGILENCREESLVSIDKKQLECINNMIKNLDSLNYYNILPNCQEGLSLLSDVIVYS